MKKFEIFGGYRNASFGVIGTYTGVDDLHVGDIISYVSHYKNNKSDIGLIVHVDGRFTIMGWCSLDLTCILDKEIQSYSKVIPYDTVTNIDDLSRLLNTCSVDRDYFSVEEHVKEMTLEEIEGILCCKIKIKQ